MARPREFDEKHVVDALMSVFWTKGYEATALSDIMHATGLGKGSLYAAFGDKRAMYLKALAEYEARYVDATVDMMSQLPGDEALAALLEAPAIAAEDNDTRGCFLCNASLDVISLDENAKDALAASNQKMLNAISKAWMDLRGDASSRAVGTAADQILAFYFGLRILARSGFDADKIRAAADSYKLP